jgi:hypothetical protein
MASINGTCSCGAKFHYDDETRYSLGARIAVKEWRETHHHVIPLHPEAPPIPSLPPPSWMSDKPV